MKITSEHFDQLAVMTVEGDFTVAHVGRFRRDVLERFDDKTRDIVLDLSRTTFVDSKALESLLWLQDQCAERLGQVRLSGCTERLLMVLKVTRLISYFEIHSEVDAAVASLR